VADLSKNGRMALEYAKRGWQVFPLHHIHTGKCSCARPECNSAGKHPRTGQGVLEAITDPATITRWWEQWPLANIGVATGHKSGIIALDLDAKGGGMNNLTLLMDQKGRVETLTSITGSGGYHWIFTAPPDARLRSTAGVIAHGIDTRAEGGYIVVPPSNHLSGNLYEWDNAMKPAPLPEWLLELWPRQASKDGPLANPTTSSPATGDTQDPHWLSNALTNGIPEGERNSMGTRLAGYFHSRGLPGDLIQTMMQPFAARCIPPMNDAELALIIRSVQRYRIRRAPDYDDQDLQQPPGDPNFRHSGGIYVMEWPEYHITIRADRLYEDSKYSTFAEITVRSTLAGLPAHIHQARLNLVSTTARRSVIKELEQRVQEIPWGQLIETLSVKILEVHRQGDPTVQMVEYMPTEGLRHRLYPYLQERQPTIFYGQGESGKSLFSLYLGILVAANITPAHLNWWVEPGNVLYLDYETSIDEVWDRIDMITSGLQISPPDGLYYRYMTQQLAASIETIQQEVMEKRISLVIIDSGGPASLEPETSAGATNYFQALRSLGCTTLTIAHQEASGKQDRPFGSIFWRNLARSTFRFQSNIQPGADHFDVAIRHTKSNNAKRLQDRAYRFSFHDREISVTPADARAVAAALGAKNVRTVSDQVSALLGEESMTVQEIMDATGQSQNTIEKTLTADKNRFTRIPTPDGSQLWGRNYSV